MVGETNLAKILARLRPEMRPEVYVFCTVDRPRFAALNHIGLLACVFEEEGVTLVIPETVARAEGLLSVGPFRCITLQVHSSLEGVGLTATVATLLAKHEIAANLIAGYHHDHILVPAEHADRAFALLQTLTP